MRDPKYFSEPMVETVINVMRENLNRGISLCEMADIACLSPYHFHRAFHKAAGVPPGELQTALRMDAAKRLLLTTSESVVDICFDVGFSSPGTFSSRFAYLVGSSPREFRHLPRFISDNNIWDKVVRRQPSVPPASVTNAAGTVQGPVDFHGLIFVGAFPRRIPQSLPRSGTLLSVPGPYALNGLPDGLYFILVAAIPETEPDSLFLPGKEMLVGIGDYPLQVSAGEVTRPVDITLRRPIPSDPPIVTSLPMLLRRQFESVRRGGGE